MKKIRNKLIWIIPLIIIIIVYSCNKVFDNAGLPNNINSFEISATTILPKQGTLYDSITVSGMVIPRERIIISTDLSNIQVKEIYAEVGDIVKKGQKLLVLNDERLKNQYIQLKSEYERVHDEFERVKNIKDSGAISKELFIQKLKIMESAKAKLKDIELSLEYSTVKSSVNGIVYDRKVDVGSLIKANDHIYYIAHNNEIEIEAEIPETMILNLKIGQEALIIIDGYKKNISGKIRLVNLNIDGSNRTQKVKITLNDEIFFPIGLFVNAKIITKKVDGLVLPVTALQEDESGYYVWKVDTDKKVRKLCVEIKFRSSDSIIVEDNLLSNKIVAKVGSFLKDGDVVNVVEEN